MTGTMTEADLGGRMSLMEHLVELRSRLIKCFVAVALGDGADNEEHCPDVLYERPAARSTMP